MKVPLTARFYLEVVVGDFVAPGADPTPEEDITNDAFFPDVKPDEFRQTMRQDKTVTAERMRESLINAVASVNRQLGAWKALQVAAGKLTLADVDPAEIGGQPVKVHYYLRAVYSLAKAELIERYRDFDATNAGREKATEMDETDDSYRRDARWAVADIQSKPRTVVELI